MLTCNVLGSNQSWLVGVSEGMIGLPSVLVLPEVNNYIVRAYRDVIVVTNIVTRRTSKA